MAFVFFELLERCSNLAPVPVNTKEATFKGTVFAFLVGGKCRLMVGLVLEQGY